MTNRITQCPASDCLGFTESICLGPYCRGYSISWGDEECLLPFVTPLVLIQEWIPKILPNVWGLSQQTFPSSSFDRSDVPHERAQFQDSKTEAVLGEYRKISKWYSVVLDAVPIPAIGNWTWPWPSCAEGRYIMAFIRRTSMYITE